MRLGLLIKEHDYFAKKINKPRVLSLFSLVGVCFLFGIVLPLIKPNLQNSRNITYVVLASFLLGILILFWVAVFSTMNRFG